MAVGDALEVGWIVRTSRPELRAEYFIFLFNNLLQLLLLEFYLVIGVAGLTHYECRASLVALVKRHVPLVAACIATRLHKVTDLPVSEFTLVFRLLLFGTASHVWLGDVIDLKGKASC